MENERRYRDDEIAAIFKSAAASAGAEPRAVEGGGLTLRELTAIGREVGIAPELVERAAAALDRRGTPAGRSTFLGIPVAVGRVASLARAPTDREWQVLVSEVREIFSASGADRSGGGIRHWVNGNLNVFVEPADGGARIRLRTRKGDAGLFNAFGVTAVVIGIGNLVGLLTTTGPGAEFPGATMVGVGVAIIAGNALRLARWSRARDEQMARIIERASGLVSAGPEAASGAE